MSNLKQLGTECAACDFAYTAPDNDTLLHHGKTCTGSDDEILFTMEAVANAAKTNPPLARAISAHFRAHALYTVWTKKGTPVVKGYPDAYDDGLLDALAQQGLYTVPEDDESDDDDTEFALCTFFHSHVRGTCWEAGLMTLVVAQMGLYDFDPQRFRDEGNGLERCRLQYVQ
tara:strand:- start:855 stop:1370 length:516 start_codon:yes stop_codon:yes gene_type:complete